MLSGNKYTSRSSLGSAIYQCLQQIPKEDYLSAFRDWVKKLQKCVSVNGEYFEGFIFLSVVCSLFPKAIFLTFIVIKVYDKT